MCILFVGSARLARIALATAALSLAGGIATAQDRPSIAEAKAIAEEAFIYGLPIVMNYGIMYEYAIDRTSSQFKAPFNKIKNEARVFTYQDTAIITPNSDTPYSFAWLDLRAEPIVLSMPEVEKGRYYSVQLIDGNTYNYGYIGSRATGHEAGDFMVVGPDWQGEAPKGIKKVFRSGTQFSLAGYRTQLFGPEDIVNVEKTQKGYQVKPLSAFLGKTAPAPAPTIDFPKIEKALMASKFFEYLDFALQFHAVPANEAGIRAKLAKIGVGPGRTFKLGDLPPDYQQEITLGAKNGEAKIKDYLANEQKVANGWRLSDLIGDSEFVNGDWLKRAAAAMAGIYANSSAEAVYPFTTTLANGELLDGSKHSYTLTFPADGFPPVNSFWSVTMYDGKSQLLIKNAIDRYLINSSMLRDMKKNNDGSVSIYIQKESPGAGKESNWLPAPNDKIYLVMRLYWPKTEPPSILPVGEGTWQPPEVKLEH